MRKYWQIWASVIVIACLCNMAAGVTVLRAKYGIAYAFPVTVWDSNSPWSIQPTPAWEAGDAKTVRNGDTTYTNVATLTVDKGVTSWQAMSTGEMTAKTITVVYQDQTAPPVWMDDIYIIQTFGDANAYEPFDTSSATPTVDMQAVDGNAVAAANMLTVYDTYWVTDFNETTGMWNVDVQYAHGEDLVGDDRFDAIDANLVTVKAAQDTSQGNITDIVEDTDELQGDWTDGGRLDVLVDLVLTELAETDANVALTKTAALAAQTAAEKIDTPSELRLLLNNSGGEVANEPNQTTMATTISTYLDMKISDVNGAGAGATDLLTTTVAAGSSTTQFTLTAGPDGNDAYINHTIVVRDANATGYPEARKVISYIGATKTIIVDLPFSFTPAAGDAVAIPRAGYAPSGAGWGMLDPRSMFEILFAKETTDYTD